MAKNATQEKPLEVRLQQHTQNLARLLVQTIDSPAQEREKEKGEGTITVPTNNPTAAGTLTGIRQVFRDIRAEFGDEILENLEDAGSVFVSSPEAAAAAAAEVARLKARQAEIEAELVKIKESVKAAETGRTQEQWACDEILRLAMIARLKNTSAIEHTALTPWSLFGVEPPKAAPRGKPAGSGKKPNSDSADNDKVPTSAGI